jgi:hypothetical protein
VTETNERLKKCLNIPQLQFLFRNVGYYEQVNDFEHCEYQAKENGSKVFDTSVRRSAEKIKMRATFEKMHPQIKFFGLTHPGRCVEKNVIILENIEKEFKSLTKYFIENYIGNIKNNLKELKASERVTPDVFERRVRCFTDACNDLEGFAGHVAKVQAKEDLEREKTWEKRKGAIEILLVGFLMLLASSVLKCSPGGVICQGMVSFQPLAAGIGGMAGVLYGIFQRRYKFLFLLVACMVGFAFIFTNKFSVIINKFNVL